MTRLVSPASIALTGDGVRQWARTPVTSIGTVGMFRRGSRISGSTPAGFSSVSCAASRIAVAGGPVSPLSRPPRGKPTSPPWSRSLAARCCIRTSGPPSRSRGDQDQDRCLALGGRVRYGIVAAELFRAGRSNRGDKARSGAGTTAGRRSATASQRAVADQRAVHLQKSDARCARRRDAGEDSYLATTITVLAAAAAKGEGNSRAADPSCPWSGRSA